MFDEETKIFIHKNVSKCYKVGVWQLSTESGVRNYVNILSTIFTMLQNKHAKHFFRSVLSKGRGNGTAKLGR